MTDTRFLDFATYRAIDAVNWSTLRNIDVSGLRYKHFKEFPLADTPRLMLGRAVHTAVLEPDEFPTRYVVFNGATRRGKAWDEFKVANADKSILKADEYRTCLAVRDAVYANANAAALLTGTSEVTVEWTDEATGIKCKGRVDHVLTSSFSDVKTTGSVDAHAFTGLSAKMLYHAQVAFYARGLKCAENPSVIAVEITPPHDVAVFQFTDDAMLAGDQKVTELLAKLATCLERDEWPGRYSDVQELGVPDWMADPDAGFGIIVGGESV